MAVIQIERRPVPGWLPPVIIALVAALLLGSWAWQGLHSSQVNGLAIPSRYRSLAVAYEGRVWVPTQVKQLALFPDGQMMKVGEVEGIALYANPVHGMGGGGGGGLEVPATLDARPWGRVYVRVGQDRYLAMRWRPSTGI